MLKYERMKKPLLIILTVAILGALTLYINNKDQAIVAQPVVTPTPVASTNTVQPNTPITITPSTYQDGTFTGSNSDTIYGIVQVAAVVSDGKISDIQFLKMPDDQGHSQEVTAAAKPLLKSQALSKQSAHIDFVSGATQTSEGFKESLQSALDKAKA